MVLYGLAFRARDGQGSGATRALAHSGLFLLSKMAETSARKMAINSFKNRLVSPATLTLALNNAIRPIQHRLPGGGPAGNQ